MKSYTIGFVGAPNTGKETLRFAILFDDFVVYWNRTVGGTSGYDINNKLIGSIGALGNGRILELQNLDIKIEIKINLIPISKFSRLVEGFVKLCDLLVLCYRIDEPKSLAPIVEWIKEVKNKNIIHFPACSLVGTKNDLISNRESSSSFDHYLDLKNEVDIVFELTTSAKKMVNIDKLLTSIVEYCLQNLSD